MSIRKQILFSAILFIGGLLVLECTTRIGAFFLYNASPYFLFYGLPWGTADDQPEGHSAAYKGYFKFTPNKTLKQYGMFQKPTPIRINSLGFRGDDFSPQKEANTFRVICMGESSTFGFFDRDQFTYPAILQELLRDPARGLSKHGEVINAGIPHIDSDNLIAMLREELIKYDPDLITIYAAYNDSVHILDMTLLQSTMRWLHEHVAIYVAMKRLISLLGGPELHSKYAQYAQMSNRGYVEKQVALHIRKYEKNIRDIVSLAYDRGVRVLFIRQPAKFLDKRDLASSEAKWAYEDDVSAVKGRLDNGEFLSSNEVTLVIHSELLQTLDQVAKELSVPVVDNVSIMNQHPEYFASYVHLTEDGNKALASALVETIASTFLLK